ncbi:MobF family relaxase, partial [Nocardia carnea]|uniref:MobF family relaxase n=1 Tax=Nocardia carnea TaxID=37328 RepID=UPI002454F81E
MVTATLHKITAGDGYEYYTRQVAAHDASERGRSSLADFYSTRGESPGRWMGSGLKGLSLKYRSRRMKASRIRAGDTVTEDQMKSLFGLGKHPQENQISDYVVAKEIARGAKRKQALRAAEKYCRLGAPFRIYDGASEYRKRCAQTFSDYNRRAGESKYAPIPDDVRAALRTEVAQEMFREELGRDPLDVRELSGWVARRSRQRTTAVAGYDWTFSPMKSFSALWAVAPPELRKKLEAIHHNAVEIAMAYLENNATYTRLGRNGVQQVDVDGLIAVAFDHRSSRTGCPDLHTHVAVANRVRTRVHGQWQWRTLDGTMFYRAGVTASEIYQTAIELGSEEMGMLLADRTDTKPGKRPVREIVGVDSRLIEHWSRRRSAITERIGQLSVQFQHKHGREPTPVEMYRLSEQATLETRQRKKTLRSAEQDFNLWGSEATTVLGGDDRIEAMIAMTFSQPPRRRRNLDAAFISSCATDVLATVSAERSTWRRRHIRNETERRIRGLIDWSNWETVSAAVVEEALSPRRSIARGHPDLYDHPELRTTPQLYRRADGTSAYTTADSQLYTSPEILDIEAKLLEIARDAGGRTIPTELVTTAAASHNARPENEHKQLKQGQLATVQGFATSGLRMQVANAPAGTGKTSAMKVLTDAWLASGGTVLGLAPTAKAAKELTKGIGVRVATVDKLLHVLDRHTPSRERIALDPDGPPANLPEWVLQIDRNTLIIVDEHVQISDRKRLRMLQYLLMRNATIRFIGDDMQLPAIESGGTVADIIEATKDDVQTLTHVVRFADPAEARATLRIRQGHTAGLGYYLDHSRIYVGTLAAVIEAVFVSWLADRAAGHDTIMLAAHHDVVTELNRLARADRLAGSTESPTREVELADNLYASVGDTIRTGRNAPTLIIGEDYVRNGYQWTVTDVHADGAITAVLATADGHGPQVTLPAEYVAADVRLGYAATINSVQGATVATSKTVLTGKESRYQLYVAISRGWLRNDLFVATAVDGSEESMFTEQALRPRTAVDVIIQVLGRDNAPKSAHSELRDALDPLQRLTTAVDIYLDALDVASVHALGPAASAELDHDVERVHPGLTDCPAYPTLRAHLTALSLHGRDPVAALTRAIAERELDTADDTAAVLHWRLTKDNARFVGTGPLPWLPGIPKAIARDPELGAFLLARSRVITELAERIRGTTRRHTSVTAPHWARPLVGTHPRLLEDLAVWRAATGVSEQDLRPCGPPLRHGRESLHYEHLSLRVNEAIGDTNLAVSKWAPLAKRINTRLLSDPFWPELATHLDVADKAGINVETELTTAAGTRPLPDELPAAALWSRLDWEPSALDGTGTPLQPAWATELQAVVGVDAADRITTDPSWPKVVAAIERASSTQWTPRELLEVATELLDGAITDDDRLRPDQFATALAWRIDALIHPIPFWTNPEEPPDDPEAPGSDTYPDDDTEDLPPEDTMVNDPGDPTIARDAERGTSPAPQPAGHGTEGELVELPGEIDAAAALYRAGNIDAAAQLLDHVPERYLSTIRRVHNTLTDFPFAAAHVRLQRAAGRQGDPAVRALIRAFTPDADPALHRQDLGRTTAPPESPAGQDAARNTVKLPDEVAAAAALLRSGSSAEEVRDRLPEGYRSAMTRIERTLTEFPFPTARARLQRAAGRQDDPVLRAVIQACTPDTDPGLFRTPETADGKSAQPKSAESGRADVPANLPTEVAEMAALYRSGDLEAGRQALDQVPERYRSTLAQIHKTLTTRPFVVARARLQWAAGLQDDPELRALIQAFTPDTDPRLYRRPSNRDRWLPPRDRRSRTDPSRRIPRDQQRGEADVVTGYFADRTDHIIQPGEDPRYTDTKLDSDGADTGTSDNTIAGWERHTSKPSKRGATAEIYKELRSAQTEEKLRDLEAEEARKEYGSGGDHEAIAAEPVHDLPCVECGLERPASDWHQQNNPSRPNKRHDDGLCADCRETNPLTGIPENAQLGRIEARCEYIVATRTPTEALAFLKRDLYRLPLGPRETLRAWVQERGLVDAAKAEAAALTAAEPDQENTSSEQTALHALSDDELRAGRDELRQRLILIGSTVSALDEIQPTPSASKEGIEAVDAIAYARETAAAGAGAPARRHHHPPHHRGSLVESALLLPLLPPPPRAAPPPPPRPCQPQ